MENAIKGGFLACWARSYCGDGNTDGDTVQNRPLGMVNVGEEKPLLLIQCAASCTSTYGFLSHPSWICVRL